MSEHKKRWRREQKCPNLVKKNNVMTLLVFIRYLEIFLSFFLMEKKSISAFQILH